MHAYSASWVCCGLPEQQEQQVTQQTVQLS